MSNNNGFLAFLKHNIPKMIWAIGISSLLANIATSVIFAGTALYMKVILGATVSTIGLLEAVVEAISYGVRIFSGVISDFLRRRKAVMIVGFILLAISKPLLAFSKNVSQVFLARTLDRIGNGIQASPREAFIGDTAPSNVKGACYGLRQSLAVIGSTLGGIFGVIVMKVSNNDFELMFLLASIPAFISVFVIIFVVKEKMEVKSKKHLRRPIKFHDLKLLGGKFWLLMSIVVVFMLGRFSEIFIALNACDNYGLDIAYGTLISVLFNMTYALSSYPAGKFSDKFEKTTILLSGFLILLVAHITIYTAPNIFFLFLGTVIWGLQIGITQSIFAILVSDYVPKDLRGTGFGVFYFVTAISTAIASLNAGILSNASGTESTAFLYGAVLCSCAIILLLTFKKKLHVQDFN
ncbi:MAG: MFS transporter [Holosporales bacterium]|jgi:MFS family permease|nr:MFS transporter [Holosporales bacterium]